MYALTPEAGVPDFICENPSVVSDALGPDPLMTMQTAVLKAFEYVDRHIHYYDKTISNPTTALAANRGNCFSRAAILHGILSSLPHVRSSIVVTTGHAQNAFAERQGPQAVIVGNNVNYDRDTEEDIGTLQLTIKPKVDDRKLILHDVNGSTAFLLRNSGDSDTGAIPLWTLFEPPENDQLFSTPTVLYDEPRDTDLGNICKVKPSIILIGKSATHLVNIISQHRQLDTSLRSEEVSKAMAVLRSKPVMPFRNSSYMHTVQTSSPLL